jgi:uncharacterized protein YndB with AHSA1/START domain
MKTPVQAVVVRQFPHPAERVFDAWLDAEFLGRWMFGPGVRDERIVRLTLDARVGGSFSFVVDRSGDEVDHVGEYLEIERPRRLAFSWATRDSLPETSRVVVEITPGSGGGCKLKLTHDMGDDWAEYVGPAANSWKNMLAALDTALG